MFPACKRDAMTLYIQFSTTHNILLTINYEIHSFKVIENCTISTTSLGHFTIDNLTIIISKNVVIHTPSKLLGATNAVQYTKCWSSHAEGVRVNFLDQPKCMQHGSGRKTYLGVSQAGGRYTEQRHC